MSTENSKLVNDYLPGVGVVLLAMCSFLGMLYIRKGNIILTSIIIFIGVLALFGCIYALWKSKEAKRNSGFDGKEVALLAAITSITFLAFIPIFHFSNLEFNVKAEIKNLGQQIAKEIRGLPSEFEKQTTVAMTRMETLLENGGNSQDEINARKNTVNRTLSVAKQDLARDSALIGRNANLIASWNRFQLNQAFFDLDKTLDLHVEKLRSSFQEPSVDGWSGEFDYKRQYAAGEIISNPGILINNDNYQVDYIIPFVVCLFCLLLMLVPYFLQKRGRIFKDLHRPD